MGERALGDCYFAAARLPSDYSLAVPTFNPDIG
jgi:hypothetical protein